MDACLSYRRCRLRINLTMTRLRKGNAVQPEIRVCHSCSAVTTWVVEGIFGGFRDQSMNEDLKCRWQRFEVMPEA